MEGLDIVITVSPHGEIPEVAIESVLKANSQKEVGIDTIHLVSITKPNYSTWPKHLEAMKQRNITYVWHNGGRLDPSRLHGLSPVFMSANMKINALAFNPLWDEFQKHGSTYDEYALRAAVQAPTNPFGWLAAGFVLIAMLIDSLRTWANWGGYHVPMTDLRIKVFSNMPDRTCESKRHSYFVYEWLIGPAYNKRVLHLASPHQFMLAPPNMVTFMWRFIASHPHLSLIGLPWLSCFVVYYFALALPWWNAYFSPRTFDAPSNIIIWLIKWSLIRNVYNPFWISLWLVNMVVIFFFARNRLFNIRNVQQLFGLLVTVLLLPAYLTLFPIILVLGRFYRVANQNEVDE